MGLRRRPGRQPLPTPPLRGRGPPRRPRPSGHAARPVAGAFPRQECRRARRRGVSGRAAGHLRRRPLERGDARRQWPSAQRVPADVRPTRKHTFRCVRKSRRPGVWEKRSGMSYPGPLYLPNRPRGPHSHSGGLVATRPIAGLSAAAAFATAKGVARARLLDFCFSLRGGKETDTATLPSFSPLDALSH